jgi:hypothetical protein
VMRATLFWAKSRLLGRGFYYDVSSSWVVGAPQTSLELLELLMRPGTVDVFVLREPVAHSNQNPTTLGISVHSVAFLIAGRGAVARYTRPRRFGYDF